MHPEMRRKGGLILSCLVVLTVLLLQAGAVSAAESVTTLRNKTITVTGEWEKNTDARIPFAIDDFQGFRYFNLSYRINTETTESISACGLVFLLTTDEYWAARKNGSGLVYVPLAENLRVFNDGFLHFDPRTNQEPSWQKGKYWLFVNIKPANCVNEANIRLDLVRDVEGVTAAPAMPVLATTPAPAAPAVSPRGTTAAVATTAAGTPSPVATQASAGPGSPPAAPTKAPLPGYIPGLAVAGALCLIGMRRAGRG